MDTECQTLPLGCVRASCIHPAHCGLDAFEDPIYCLFVALFAPTSPIPDALQYRRYLSTRQIRCKPVNQGTTCRCERTSRSNPLLPEGRNDIRAVKRVLPHRCSLMVVPLESVTTLAEPRTRAAEVMEAWAFEGCVEILLLFSDCHIWDFADGRFQITEQFIDNFL